MGNAGASAARRRVALLVVHGIGDSKRGVTRAKVIEGLRAAYGNDFVVEEEDSRGAIPIELPMEDGHCSARLYEVYWADLLRESERGSFATSDVGPTAWYPLANLAGAKYPAGHGNPFFVWVSTMALVPFVGLFWCGYVGLTTLASAIASALNRERSDKRSWVDDTLDKYAGDISTYIKSLRGATAVNSARFDAAERILLKFREVFAAATNDPNVDEIQILAHSLGTVIAHHALSAERPATSANVLNEVGDDFDDSGGVLAKPLDARKPVTALLTIGSPLQKILFFWPELVAGRIRIEGPAGTEASGRTLQWTNFYNLFDPVSGRLEGLSPEIPIKDQRIWAGGAVTSHTVYESNRAFLGTLTKQLTGTARRPRFNAWKATLRVLTSPLETALALIAIPLVVVVGAAFVAALLGLVPRGLGWIADQIGMTGLGTQLADWGGLAMLLGLLTWLAVSHRSAAKLLRQSTARIYVPSPLLDATLRATATAVEEGFGEAEEALVASAIASGKRHRFDYRVQASGQAGGFVLQVVRVGKEGYVFTYYGDRHVIDPVRAHLRAIWQFWKQKDEKIGDPDGTAESESTLTAT